MKKALAFILALAMVLPMVACASSPPTSLAQKAKPMS